ncbi:hypothetical protein RD792_000217 [Penstemon davidsonii]|uniref:Uncharacterized protein n=1 Tax=Penstemon davidsonii TaxID=160366 RepID=A0ABR0DUR8_9LAMI|nr:hypothetical protein RD792_000217 [Penstemon davidsonii]
MGKQAAIFLIFFYLMKVLCFAASPLNSSADEHSLLAIKAHITFDANNILASNWVVHDPVNRPDRPETEVSVCTEYRTEFSVRYSVRTRLPNLESIRFSVKPTGLPNRTALKAKAINLFSLLLRTARAKPKSSSSSIQNSTAPPHHPPPPRRRTAILLLASAISLSRSRFVIYREYRTNRYTEIRYGSVRFYRLHSPSLNGIIPDEIGSLRRLRRVEMSFNQLSSEIPLSFGLLTKLEFLGIEGNHLTGAIPWSIFKISSLQSIGFTENKLYGTLPNDMCYHLPKLEGLYLSNNQLRGDIPTSLSACSQLEELSLSYNNFSGAIPMQMGNLSQLHILALGSNKITGKSLDII